MPKVHRSAVPMLPLLCLLLVAGASVKVPSLPPARASYCVPVAVRDYEVLVGRSAQVRPAPGCARSSLIRRVSNLSGYATPPIEVPVPSESRFNFQIFLFMSRLEYSLDGRLWLPLEVEK